MLRFSLLLALFAPAALQAQSVQIAIDLSGQNVEGASVGVRGDTAPLAWDRSLPLQDDDGDGVHTTTLVFPEGTGLVAYKAVMEASGTEIVWEPGDNRVLVPGRMAEDQRAFGAPQTGLPEVTVSQAGLAEDIGILVSAMQALHPGLTLHATEAELGQTLQRLNAGARALGTEYGEAIPQSEAYLILAGAVAAIRDGHTQISMYNQSGYLAATLYARPDRVPFAFRLVGDRMIVTADATADRLLPAGTEVLSLDGRPVPEVLAAIAPYASADGGNDAKRFDQLEVTGLLPPAERFDVFYSLLFEPTGPLTLTVRHPDGTSASLQAERLSRDARRDRLWARDPDAPRSSGDLLQARILDDGTAYLYIGSFATFNMDVDYAAWLTEAFRMFAEAEAERLVVDLRDVAGGADDAATLLFRHLLQEPAEVAFWQNSTVYERVPEAVRAHVRSWSDAAFDLTGQVTSTGDGRFALPARPPVTVPPAPDPFRGRIAVLVDATASSATFYLAQQIQAAGAAVLVGQPTGGSLKGLNGGQMAFLDLPNTGLVVDVPLLAARPSASGPDRGVRPDVIVPLDADAVIAGRDPELEAALERLRGAEE